MEERFQEKIREASGYSIEYMNGKKDWTWVRNSFNEACEICHTNVPTIGATDSYIERRKLVAQKLVIYSIHALQGWQLDKLQEELYKEAENLE